MNWVVKLDRFDQACIQCNLNGFQPNSTRQAYNVISMDFHPIRLIRPGIISMNWVEIHWDYIVCLPGRIGLKSIEITLYACQCNLNGFPPNLTDSTRHHLNELGGNPLGLHCMPAQLNWSNWASSQWISIQFDHPIQPI